jgi:hypothetical protein
MLQDAVAKAQAPAAGRMRHMLRSHTMPFQREIIQVTDTRVGLNLPAAFLNRRVEVIAVTMDAGPSPAGRCRQPSALIAEKGPHPGGLGRADCCPCRLGVSAVIVLDCFVLQHAS